MAEAYGFEIGQILLDPYDAIHRVVAICRGPHLEEALVSLLQITPSAEPTIRIFEAGTLAVLIHEGALEWRTAEEHRRIRRIERLLRARSPQHPPQQPRPLADMPSWSKMRELARDGLLTFGSELVRRPEAVRRAEAASPRRRGPGGGAPASPTVN